MGQPKCGHGKCIVYFANDEQDLRKVAPRARNGFETEISVSGEGNYDGQSWVRADPRSSGYKAARRFWHEDIHRIRPYISSNKCYGAIPAMS